MKKEIRKTQSCIDHLKTLRIKAIDAKMRNTILTYRMKRKKSTILELK